MSWEATGGGFGPVMSLYLGVLLMVWFGGVFMVGGLVAYQVWKREKREQAARVKAERIKTERFWQWLNS